MNGKKIHPGKSAPLNAWDRVVFGNDLYMFIMPGAPPPVVKDGDPDPTTADYAATEFRQALKDNQSTAEKAGKFIKNVKKIFDLSCSEYLYKPSLILVVIIVKLDFIS